MKKTILAIVLSFLFGLLALPSMASDRKTPLPPEDAPRPKNYFSIMSQITFTPVATIYLPIVLFSLPPPPPVPPPPPPPTPGPHGIIGKITFRDERNTYAVGETVFVNIEATNMEAGPISFGILGLTPSVGSFKISWTNGNIASGETFKLEDGLAFSTPGMHRLWMSICFSSLQECQGPNGDWERFEPGLDIVVFTDQIFLPIILK
ncbi:MAG: hypothetical protein HS126_18990 [Anaerolineales bacterium]|nr:hypothetical protein [Anaerolineales bacterium]